MTPRRFKIVPEGGTPAVQSLALPTFAKLR